jgi:hypothetical protein
MKIGRLRLAVASFKKMASTLADNPIYHSRQRQHPSGNISEHPFSKAP